MGSGEWRVESGEWRVESGERGAESDVFFVVEDTIFGLDVRLRKKKGKE